MKGVAIIPARSGSKRIPNKNVKLFSGKPMIEYALSIASKAKIFEKIIVSSDSDEILSISKKSLSEVHTYKRSNQLSDDFTGTIPVINDVIKNLDLDDDYDFTCCLYPCVPLLSEDRLIEGYDLLKDNPSHYILPIKRFESSIHRSFSLDLENTIKLNFPSNQTSRTQDLETAFYDAGQFYFGMNNLWLSETNLHSCSTGIELKNDETVDIDEIDDWLLAERLFKLKNNG